MKIMTDSSTGITNYIIPISLTVGSMICPSIESPSTDLTGLEFSFPNREMVTGLEEDERGSYSTVMSSRLTDLEHATVLHEFLSSLVRESRDLDIDIVEAVNEHLWDLI